MTTTTQPQVHFNHYLRTLQQTEALMLGRGYSREDFWQSVAAAPMADRNAYMLATQDVHNTVHQAVRLAHPEWMDDDAAVRQEARRIIGDWDIDVMLRIRSAADRIASAYRQSLEAGSDAYDELAREIEWQ